MEKLIVVYGRIFQLFFFVLEVLNRLFFDFNKVFYKILYGIFRRWKNYGNKI